MEDLFRTLRAGTKLKKPKGQHLGSSSAPLRSKTGSTAALPSASSSSLDFFRSSTPAAGQKHKRPREETAPVQPRSSVPKIQEVETANGASARKKMKKKKGDKGKQVEQEASTVKLFSRETTKAAAEKEAAESESDSDDEPRYVTLSGDSSTPKIGIQCAQSSLSARCLFALHLLERALSSSFSLVYCNGSQSVGDEVRAFRRRMRIHVYGDDCPPCIGTFADMDAGEWRGTNATLLRVAMSRRTDII